MDRLAFEKIERLWQVLKNGGRRELADTILLAYLSDQWVDGYCEKAIGVFMNSGVSEILDYAHEWKDLLYERKVNRMAELNDKLRFRTGSAYRCLKAFVSELQINEVARLPDLEDGFGFQVSIETVRQALSRIKKETGVCVETKRDVIWYCVRRNK